MSSQTYDGGVVLLEYGPGGRTAETPPARLASGTFDVELRPGGAELGGEAGRFDFDKTFHGGLTAAGSGVMLTAGDPQQGSAGDVALESVTGGWTVARAVSCCSSWAT